MFAGEGLGGDHLSLRVESPASARMKLMIQKRITTVGSLQPRCSKWWWIGAIRKMRLPVRLNQKTWTTTLTRFQHEQPADDHQHELMVRRDRDRAERSAQCEAAGVAHEDRRRRRVEPEEGEARADDRQQQHGQIASALHVRDAEIFGEARVADQVGDQR